MEDNLSFETTTLCIGFAEPSLWNLRLGPAIRNRLRRLQIRCGDVVDTKALVSCIALRRGAHVEIDHLGSNVTLGAIFSVVSTTHLSNLSSPTFMKYHSKCQFLRLSGPNGISSFKSPGDPEDPFAELPLLPIALTDIREFCLVHHNWERAPSLKLTMFKTSNLPALGVLAVDCKTSICALLFLLFAYPSSPSLKTLAFLDCNIAEGFVKELRRFVSNRKNTTSVWFHHVVSVNSNGISPSVASVEALGKNVSIVDVRMSKGLPTDPA